MPEPLRIRRWLPAIVAFAALHAFAADPPVAEVISVDGKGETREAQQPSWKPVTVRHSLYPTNFVRTLDLSRMAILFADRTQVRLSQNSVLQIKEVARAGNEKTVIDLKQGRSWTQSKTTPNGLVMETPSALAAIRGTDWEMAVDEEGRSTLSVFSGEVELSNEQGRLVVGANEQARAEKGKAPVKLLLRTSRTRIQWVSAFRIDAARYAEFRAGTGQAGEIAAMIRDERLGDAYHALARWSPAADAPGGATLLLSDFEIYRGEIGEARGLLTEGARRFPADERFDVGLARVALLEDEPAQARALAQSALAKKPGSVDALVMLGDIERHEGLAEPALSAYGRAVAAAAEEARGWYGLGAVETERENVCRARSLLEKAIALDATDATYPAELGTLEGFAGDFPRGREALERSLAIQKDNYVALTGLGVLEVKAGHLDAALEALLAATLIEPRYARAHLYLAAAYYDMEREDAALEELRRAAQNDPNDPLPYLLMSIIHLDRIEPGAAIAASRRALERIPYLKSLNQVADNQKGIANLGSGLGFMGLEAWARSSAHESYLPFWGGSHLFLADRYAGEFDRRSELMQGFITDPLAFGASNRFQSLYPEPGYHATAAMRYSSSDDLTITEPTLTLNGYTAGRIPFAYFAEAVDTKIDPRAAALGGHATTLTGALGAKPTYELGTFAYVTRLDAGIDLGQRGVTGDFARVDGNVTRADAGLRYALDASSSLWVKLGATEENSTLDDTASILLPNQSLSRFSHFVTRPRAEAISVRYTTLPREGLELTFGAEASRQREPKFLIEDSAFHFASGPNPQSSLDEHDRDRAETVYGMARWSAGDVRAELGVAWRDYRKDRDFLIHRDATPGPDQVLSEAYRLRKTDPAAGLTWRFAPAALWRLACRRWQRPIAVDTLMPVAIAGLPLDDQLVFAGGELEQCRTQWEWNPREPLFLSAYAERVRTHNLVSPLDGILNTRQDASNVERLRNRLLTPPPRPDLLEDTPVYAEGLIYRGNVAVEALVNPHLAARLHYFYTDSENTDPIFPVAPKVPYLARHQANLGLTWAPGWRTYLTVQAVYRTRRYADEVNSVLLPSSWDAQLDLYWETPDKRWAVEAYGANLWKKETADVFGIVVSYRF